MAISRTEIWLQSTGVEKVLRDYDVVTRKDAETKRKIEETGRRSRGGLTFISEGAQEAKRGLQNLADTAGPLGRVLGAAGPIGLGLAAGAVAVGVLTGATVSLSRSIGVTTDKYDLLAARLDRLGASRSMDGLIGLSRELGQSVEDTVGAFARFQIAGEGMGLVEQQVAQLTEVVFKLGRIGGSSGNELASASVQLAQGLAAGALRGEELNSVLEGMPLVAKAIAESLGVGVGELKALAEQGKLTSAAVAQGLLGNLEQVRSGFADLPRTIEQQESAIGTAWEKVLVNLDKRTRASDFYRDILLRIEQLFDATGDAVAPQSNSEKIQDRLAELRSLTDRATPDNPTVARALGNLNQASPATQSRNSERAQQLRDEIAALSELAEREAIHGVNSERLAREDARRKADDKKRLADLKEAREAAVKPLDDLLRIQGETYRLEEAITALRSGGLDYLAGIEREAKLREAARDAADKYNSSNKKAIVDGEKQLRTASDYLDVLRRQAEAKVALAAGTRMAELKEEVAAEERLAAAHLDGAAAVLAAVEAEQVRAELRKLGIKDGATEASQIEEQIRLLGEKKRLTDANEATREARDELDYQRKLAEAHADGADAVDALNVEYAVKQKLTEAGVDADTEAGRRLADVTRELERQKIATGRANEAAEVYREVWRNTLEDVQNSLTDGIEDGLAGNLSSVRDWAEEIWSIGRRLAANLAAQQLVIPIVTAGADLFGLGSAVPDAWRAAAGGAAAAGAGSAVNAGSMISSITGAIGSGFQTAAASIGSFLFGSASGGAAAAGVGAKIGGLTNAGSAGLFGTYGAGASTFAAVAPWIAAAAAIAIPLVSGMFGRRPSVGPTTVGRVTDLTDADSTVVTFDNKGDSEKEVRQIIRAIVDGIEVETRRYTGTVRPGSGFDVGYFPAPESGNSQPGGVNLKAIIANVLEGKDFAKGKSREEAVQLATFRALKDMVDYQSDTLDAIAANTDAEDLTALQRDLALGDRLDKLREALAANGGQLNVNTLALAQTTANRAEAARQFAEGNARPIVDDFERLLELFPARTTREVSSRETVRGVYAAGESDEGAARGSRFVEEGSDEFTRLTSGDGALSIVTQIRGITRTVTEQVADYAANLGRVGDSTRFASTGLQQLIQQITGEFEPAVEGVFAGDFAQRAANIRALAPDLADFNLQLREAYEAFPELTAALGLLNGVLFDVTGTINTALDTLRQQMAEDLTDSFTARRNQATGLGAINQIQALIDTRAGDLNDANTLGVDPSLALSTYADELRALAGGSDVGTLRRIIESGQLTDPQTLIILGQIRDELVEGGALDPAVATALASIEAQVSALEQSADAADALAEALYRSADALLIDTSLSPLSPEAQRAEARRQLDAAQADFAAAATPEARADAASQAQAIGRSFLQASLAVFGATPEYKDDFDYLQDLLRTMGGEARSQADVARDSLGVLVEIRDRLAPSSGTGSIDPPSGFDLGYSTDRNTLIYRTLAAANLPTPSGFGEGQLGALRAANAQVDAVVRALGFSEGGRAMGGVPGRDSVPALLMPGEDVYSVDNSAVIRRLAANNNVGPVVRRLDAVESAVLRLVSVQERMFAQQQSWAAEERGGMEAMRSALRGRSPVGARR